MACFCGRLAYGDPDRLVTILHFGQDPVSPDDYLDWRKQSRSFEQMGAAQVWSGALTGRDNAEELSGMQVSPNIFSVLGVPALRGRTFEAGDDQPGHGHVAVLSYQLWQRRFGGDPKIIGQQVNLNGESYTVNGVMPESFHFAPFWATNVEVWVPLLLDKRLNDRGGRSLRIFARLRDGVPLAQAQADIDVICRRLAAAVSGDEHGHDRPGDPAAGKSGVQHSSDAAGLAGHRWIRASDCLQQRGESDAGARQRQKEGNGGAAGAGVQPLARDPAIAGGEPAAFARRRGGGYRDCTAGGLRGLIASLPAKSLPRLDEVGIDKTVLAFTALIALLTGVVCGLAPALRAFRTDLQETLKSGGRGSTAGRSEHRTRALLVISEVALALMLLVGAGLMLRTFERLQAVDPGFDPHHVLTLEVAAGGKSYRTGPSRIRFFDQLRPRLEALPGVESISLINHLPISGDVWTLGIIIYGRPDPPPGQQPTAAYRVVQPGYFANHEDWHATRTRFQ